MNLQDFFTLKKEQLIILDPKDVRFFLNDEAIVHMAKELGAFWSYDYEVAKKGKVGYHALLKSLRHSNGFFASRILLQYLNIMEIIAFQMIYRYRYYKCPWPEWVGGIPDGATGLGAKIAEMMGVRNCEMEKVDGKIKMISQLPPFSTLLLIEDFCTRGTGFKETVREIKNQQPDVNILPYELVILNRGGLTAILIEEIGPFLIVPTANYRIDDWSSDECPLCRDFHSEPIKPKATDENWKIITTSQL